MAKNYIIGLDLGENNVGWSVIYPETNKIENKGVRLFNIAAAAADRRTSRDTRRRLKRRDNRLKESLILFESIQFPNENTIDANLLQKRIDGLKQQIEKQDIVNITCYYMTHRGYIPFGDEERELIQLNGKYPCEYYKDLIQKIGKYRALEQVVNHTDLLKEFKAILTNQMQYYPEIGKIIGDENQGLLWIFSRKRKFWEGPGSEKSFTPYGRFKDENDVVNYQKLKSTGKEKYLFEDLIGHCKIYPNEKCAPKANYYAEKFNLLNDFINIRINNYENIKNQNYIECHKAIHTKDTYYKLTNKALEDIFNYCIQFDEKSLQYTKVLKEVLGLNKNDISGYRIDKDGKPKFSLMNNYRLIKRLYKENDISFEWLNDLDSYNLLIANLAVVPGVVELTKMLDSIHKCDEKEQEILRTVQQKLKENRSLEYHALSEKALKRAINDMISTGMNYEQVSKKFDYEKEARELMVNGYGNGEGRLLMTSKYVDEIIASPAVKKTLRQSIRVINAIIEKEGEYPAVISIESAKEMNGDDRRKEIEKEQKLQEKYRQDAEEILKSCNANITNKNIEKVMLFEETNGHCAYCGKPVSLNDVLAGSYEVEHILPLSQSCDDSFNNKTIACRDCNARKGNKTPFQFLSDAEFDELSKRIKTMKLPEEKKYNLLYSEDVNKHQIRFFNRSLRDTSYATKELVNQVHLFNEYLKSNLNNTEIKTLSTPGQLTHKIREEWNLEKNRDIGKFHHAVDASIVAGIATTSIGKLIIQSQNDSQYWILHKDDLNQIPKLVTTFSMPEYKDKVSVIQSDDDVQISMQVNKDINRGFSNANITKFIKKDNEYYKIQQISDIYTPDLMRTDKKNLDILFDEKNPKYTLLCQEQDPKLFKMLQHIYTQYQDANTNPFVNYCKEKLPEDSKFNPLINGIRTPSKSGKGILVTKLRYMQSVENPYLLNKANIHKKENTLIGLDSVSIYCTRLYWDKDKKKILFMPIYAPVVNPVTGKINEQHPLYKLYYEQCIEGKNVQFIVDLFNGNYVEIEKSDGTTIKEYIKGYAKASSSIQCKSGKYLSPKDKFTLYDVDVLGNKIKRLTWPQD